MSEDYRDRLQELFAELYNKEGMTRYRLSKRAGISEQTISNVLHKRRNLSVDALERMLASLGYKIQFIPDDRPAGTGSSSVEDEKLVL